MVWVSNKMWCWLVTAAKCQVLPAAEDPKLSFPLTWMRTSGDVSTLRHIIVLEFVCLQSELCCSQWAEWKWKVACLLWRKGLLTELTRLWWFYKWTDEQIYGYLAQSCKFLKSKIRSKENLIPISIICLYMHFWKKRVQLLLPQKPVSYKVAFVSNWDSQ